MRIKLNGNKLDKVLVSARSAEASATIPVGTPVALVANGTDDGLAVVLPATSSAAKLASFQYGVACKDILPGEVGEVCVFGVCNVKLTLQTRANTSGGSSFSTAETVALGNLLTIFSAGNAFSTIAHTVAIASTDALTQSNYEPAKAAIFQSLASSAGIATGTAETRLTVTQMVKAFIRMM